MNFNELVKEAYEACACNTDNFKMKKSEALDFAKQLLATVIDTVAVGEKVQIVDFGTFAPKAKAERNARNPMNGEAIIVPAKTVPTFKPSKLFKETVNG